jgi:sulfatase modifying factor 1
VLLWAGFAFAADCHVTLAELRPRLAAGAAAVAPLEFESELPMDITMFPVSPAGAASVKTFADVSCVREPLTPADAARVHVVGAAFLPQLISSTQKKDGDAGLHFLAAQRLDPSLGLPAFDAVKAAARSERTAARRPGSVVLAPGVDVLYDGGAERPDRLPTVAQVRVDGEVVSTTYLEPGDPLPVHPGISVVPASNPREVGPRSGYAMRLVPAETASVGWVPDDPAMKRPNRHDVAFPASWVGEVEVTQSLWTTVMGAPRPSVTKDLRPVIGDSLPVFDLAWSDAVAFANAMSVLDGFAPAYAVDGKRVTRVAGANGYRLPTEDEWEHAAGAGQGMRFSGAWGDMSVCVVGNVADASVRRAPHPGLLSMLEIARCDDGYPGLAPVGSFRPNAWGLFDMTGNVREWCENADPNPGWGDWHAVRGGSYSGPYSSARLTEPTMANPGMPGLEDTSPANGVRLVRPAG